VRLASPPCLVPVLLGALAACVPPAASLDAGDGVTLVLDPPAADGGSPPSDGGPRDTGPTPLPSDGGAHDGGANDVDASAHDAGALSPSDAGALLAATFIDPGPLVVAEREWLDVTFAIEHDDPGVRLFAVSLPPGARFDEPARRLRFRPDFVQGGRSYPLHFVLDDGGERTFVELSVEVSDTIAPPVPVITETLELGAARRLVVSQTTDAFLDAPAFAGRAFTAYVMGPSAPPADGTLPVRVALHGFDGPPLTDAWEGEIRVVATDPDNTYWWGYRDPEAPTSSPPYTQRRVLHLLAWVLDTWPSADPENVYVEGWSMGGAGALGIGLHHARHVNLIDARIGQGIPRNHRPTRVAQLSGLWGAPGDALDDGDGMSPWDRQDVTRLLDDHPEARGPWLFLKHGKDDPTIHFGAVVHDSPLTGRSIYGTLQLQHIGHYAVWDEGAHGVPDPVLGDAWWHLGYNPVFDDVAWLRRNQPYPAYSHSSHDDDPGDGTGIPPLDPESAYAGVLETPGDTRWSGELAGALNRFLRWDANATVDTIDTLALTLFAVASSGGAPPAAGYPTTGDLIDPALPILVDVTPRRAQRFRLAPGESVAWTYGDASGTAIADARGEVTVVDLPVGTTPTLLTLVRAP
jgi:hypothetical protein